MVRDLSIPVKILRGKLVREDTGLAMSSRNSRLSQQGKQQALALYFILSECKKLLHSGLNQVAVIKEKALFQATNKFPGFMLEYLHLIDEVTLVPLENIISNNHARAVIAGYVEGVRLIDTECLNFVSSTRQNL